MGLVTKNYTFSNGATIYAAENNANFDTLYNVVNGNLSNVNIIASAAIAYSKLNLAASITSSDVSATAGITGTQLSATAAIADTQLATISTAGKVSGAALTSLTSTPSGAGALPIANGGTGQVTAQAATDALLPAQGSASGKYLTTNGTNASWGTVSANNYTAGATYLLASLDTERSSTSATYVIKKSIAVPRSGTFRISFDITSKSTDTAKTAIGRIYKSGVAFGTERSAVDQVAYTTFSEDLAFAMGDTIDIYIKNEGGFPGGGTSYVQNFRIYATAPATFATVTDS